MSDQPQPPPVDAAPTWRRQPYRLFFPAGLVFVWAGLLPWFLIATGAVVGHPSIYHSIAQIQGFMLCFAVGFLFTMVPRRTRTPAPTATQMVIGLVAPAGITICSGVGAHAASQLFWLVLAVMLVAFVASRFRTAGAERGLPGFVWVPISVLFGVVGTALFGVYGALGAEHWRLHRLAQVFLLQGMFLGFVVGVGSMVFPLFTRGESPPEASPADRGRLWLHVFAAALLTGTFFCEVYGDPQLGFLGRAAVCFGLLIWSGGIHRLPTRPGANCRSVWCAAWMIPIGYAIAGLWPRHYQAGLHIVLIGGFALLALAVSLHVTLAHGGRKPVLEAWGPRTVAIGALVIFATFARTMMVFDSSSYFAWMGVATGCFLLGSLVWASLVIPTVLARRST